MCTRESNWYFDDYFKQIKKKRKISNGLLLNICHCIIKYDRNLVCLQLTVVSTVLCRLNYHRVRSHGHVKAKSNTLIASQSFYLIKIKSSLLFEHVDLLDPTFISYCLINTQGIYIFFILHRKYSLTCVSAYITCKGGIEAKLLKLVVSSLVLRNGDFD